ncbi:hypothetical protein [Alicyclobacillus kakegawensis]|uniref:hypothetical protein n=1 Tax=Alicyclobacillus kakegawensis TaxID=392012 RepID=UPI000835709B|nr:hypothetical protein [Alicyclobacillus kakegawensis]
MSIRLKGRKAYWNRRHIGDIQGTTFRKEVHSTKHRLHRVAGGAYAVQTELLPFLKEHDVRIINVHEIDTGATWSTSINMFERHAVSIEFGTHGQQLALPLQYWERVTPGQTTLLLGI